jgi:DNA-binding CsgD family transcriptional regulator
VTRLKSRSDGESSPSAGNAATGDRNPSANVPEQRGHRGADRLGQRRKSAGRRRSGDRPLSAREREIFALRAAGWTLREIGERYGISRQRVDEIVRDRGGPRLPEVVAARRARTEEIISERSAEIRRWWRAGLSIGEIADRLGLPVAPAHRAIGRVLDPIDRAHRNRAIVTRTRTRRYSRNELTAGLRAVAERVGATPTQEEYRAIARGLKLASILTLGKRFGSWQEAITAAGLTPLPGARRQRSRYRWDKEACWEALERVAGQIGNPPRFQSYVQLSTGRDDLPSGPTIRNQLGRWIDIVIELATRQGARENPHPGP